MSESRTILGASSKMNFPPSTFRASESNVSRFLTHRVRGRENVLLLTVAAPTNEIVRFGRGASNPSSNSTFCTRGGGGLPSIGVKNDTLRDGGVSLIFGFSLVSSSLTSRLKASTGLCSALDRPTVRLVSLLGALFWVSSRLVLVGVRVVKRLSTLFVMAGVGRNVLRMQSGC